jgi:hypothetical protein
MTHAYAKSFLHPKTRQRESLSRTITIFPYLASRGKILGLRTENIQDIKKINSRQMNIMKKCFVISMGLMLLCCVKSELTSAKRRLEAGDFSELNAILADAVIYLGDVSVSEGFLLNLSLKNLKCTNFAIGDILISSTRRSDDVVALDIDVYDLTMDCSLDFNYQTFLFITGGGQATVQANNSASATAIFTSSNFDQDPPTSSSLESCAAIVNLVNLQFLNGGILSLDTVESILARTVESQAERTICEQLREMTTTALVQQLENAKATLAKYPAELTGVDPLSREAELLEQLSESTENIKLINLLQRETEIGQLLDVSLRELVQFLAQNVSNDAGYQELKVNSVLRDTLLEDRALLLNATDFDFMKDGILWQRQDKLTDTTIYLNSIKLYGVDTLQNFHPFDFIGNYTIQNKVLWEYLTFEVNATVDIRPSSSPDSILVEPGSNQVVEHITIQFGFEAVEIVISFLLALKKDVIENLQLGSLLKWDNVFSCMVDSLFKLEIPAFVVSTINMKEPTLDGFVSAGIDRLITDTTLSAFTMYESILLKSAPAFFQITVRSAINKLIESELNKVTSNLGTCPSVNSKGSKRELVDFRDLLLEPSIASSMGGSGSEPYGEIAHTLFAQFKDRFVDTGDDGLPKINSAIRSATKAQSDVEGEIHLSDPFTFLWMQNTTSVDSLFNQVKINANSINISNLDSIVLPFEPLDVVDARRVSNSINMGQIAERPIRLTSEILFQIIGDKTSPLSVSNLMRISLSFQSSIHLEMLATMLKKEVFELPLLHATNPWCWLMTVEPPDFDLRTQSSQDKGIQLSDFGIYIADLDLGVECVRCTSRGGKSLPEILNVLKKSNAIQILEEHLMRVIDESSSSSWDSLDLPNRIAKSRKLCPYSPSYDPNAELLFQRPGIRALNQRAIESLVMMSSLALNFGIILVVESHILSPSKATNPLSNEKLFSRSEKRRMVNWQDVEDSIGKPAEFCIDQARAYFNRVLENNESGKSYPQANVFIQNMMKDTHFTLPIGSSSVNLLGSAWNLTELRIFGLDSMLTADVLHAVGNLTLSHRLKFKKISLETDVTVNTPNTFETITLSYSMKNVDLQLATLVGLEWRKLGTARVQSILWMETIPRCVISKLYAANVTQMLINAETFASPKLKGLRDQNASQALDKASQQFFSHFSEHLIASLPVISDTTLRDSINLYLRSVKVDDNSCEAKRKLPRNGTIDFRDFLLDENESRSLGGKGGAPYGNTFPFIYKALREKISVESKENGSLVNEVIRHFTRGQSYTNGSLSFLGDLFHATGTTTVNTWKIKTESRLSHVYVENLDSVGHPLKIMEPISGYANVLNNSLSIGMDSKPLKFGATFLLAVSDDDELNIRNEFNVSLEVHDITVSVALFLAMSENIFFDISLEHLQEINCWLATIEPDSFLQDTDAAKLSDYRVTAKKADINISCVSCSSPFFSDLVYELYNPGKNQDEVQSFVDKANDLLKSLLGSNFLQSITQTIVSDAEKLCPASKAYNSSAEKGKFRFQPEQLNIFNGSNKKKLMVFNVVNIVVAATIIVLACIIRWEIRRKHVAWRNNLSDELLERLRRQQEFEDAKEKFLNENTESMFRSDQIPRRIRYAVPFILAFNILMFIVAHSALLFYINVNAQIAGEPFIVEHFINFTFFRAALDTFQSGGSEMAIFLFAFSGIWPYIKLMAAMFLWFAKPDKLSVSCREKIILWMDALTKLSIIDVVNMIIALAVFLVFIGGPGDGSSDMKKFYSMILVIVPQIGLYAILIAQRLNRVTSRFFLDYHNKIVLASLEEFKMINCSSVMETSESFNIETKPTHAMISNIPSSFTTSFEVSSVESDEFSTENTKTFYEARSVAATSHVVTSYILKRESCPTNTALETTIDLQEDEFMEDVTMEEGNVHVIPRERNKTRGDFLFFNPNDNAMKELNESFNDSNDARARCLKFLPCIACLHHRALGGTVSAAIAFIFAGILFIIGCLLAPSISMDTREIWSLTLQSGRTYAEAVEDFNAFRMISLVLLKSQFLLDSVADYVGLGILLSLAGIATIAFPISQAWKVFKTWRNSRRGVIAEVSESPSLPTFNEIKHHFLTWKHFEVFVISFCLANWQLCAAASYLLHKYCGILSRLYEALGNVGLVERTSANCFQAQALHPFTFILFSTSFSMIFISFIFQARDQYNKNVAQIAVLRLNES